ncbi:hypothetical protein pb186bvf_005768 [Paramecium bursaria]
MREQRKSIEQLFKKYEEAQYRYQLKLDEKIQKAKMETEKLKEVHFIQMMDMQYKRMDYDDKVRESQERKKDLEKLASEKFSQRKIKEDEVRRKKKEYEDERLNKLKVIIQKKEETKKIRRKETTKIRKQDDFKILMDETFLDESQEIEHRQYKSMSPSFRPLYTDSIVYFDLKKQKSDLEDKIKINKKQKQVPQKVFRDSSVPIRRIHIALPTLVRNDDYIIMSPILKPMQHEDNSHNVTPKKEEELQQFRLCQICNITIEEDDNVHLQSKAHKNTKSYYGLATQQGDIILVKGSKEDMSANRIQAIRKRCQKIKQTISQKSLQLEQYSMYGYKEPAPGLNRQRIQKISIELDKLLNNQIKDLDLIENCMKDLLRQISMDDMIHLRQMKFIQIIIDTYKKVSACRKNEYQQFLKIIGIATQILYQYCQVSDNRTYMLVSNKVLPVIDFMYTFLATKPTKFIYGFSFVAQCFQIFSLLIKHKLQPDPKLDLHDNLNIDIQVDTLEYMFCCGIFSKMKQRFLSFEKDYINSDGKIPVALVKSVAFIEAATNYHGFDLQSKSIFEQSNKINKNLQKHVDFVIEETELFGLIPLISEMLVGEGVSLKINKLIPQTVISFLMVGIKTLNNIARLNLKYFQQLIFSIKYRQETSMIISTLLCYCRCTMDQSADLRDLLQEVILLIGYCTVLNQEVQHQIVGHMKQSSILHNLIQMPSQFFVDKQLRNVLFPTLLCCIFNSPDNMKIVMDEMDKSYFLEMLQEDTQEPQYQQQPMMQRSPSMSSTNSQSSVFPFSTHIQYRLLSRFPKQLLHEAIIELQNYQD